METFKKILVVSRSTRNCVKVLHTGISLAKKYGASLHVLHVIYDPYYFSGYGFPFAALEEELQHEINKAREELDIIIQAEKAEGMTITETVKRGKPVEEILKAVESHNADLILMLAHEEGRLEHFLFGRTNEAIVRKLPATLMLVK
jgi:nucleotide-binding universal stress UspA family protein